MFYLQNKIEPRTMILKMKLEKILHSITSRYGGMF